MQEPVPICSRAAQQRWTAVSRLRQPRTQPRLPRKSSQPAADSSARSKLCKDARRKHFAALIKLLAQRVGLNERMRMADPNFVETSSSQATDSTFIRASSLPRRLGLWSAVAVLVGSTIGSGIFRSPAGIANRLPGPLPLLAIWLTGGLFAFCGALTLAEVAGGFPPPGGGVFSHPLAV